ADVFSPELRVILDESAQHVDTRFRVEIGYLNTSVGEPMLAALEVDRLADDDLCDPELADKAAAVPAGGESCDHDRVAIASASAGVPEGVCLAVDGRVAVLN